MNIKRLLAIVMIAVLCVLCCACGSENADTSSGSTADTSSDTLSENTADATLTVKVKKGEITKFKSDRPYDNSKEDISLILVIGQSNFTTSVGFPSEYGGLVDGKTEVKPEAPLTPVKGTVYSGAAKGTITALTDDRDVSNLCDTSRLTSTMGGVTPSFGYQWNALTGTKVVFVQAAVGGVGVHEWTPKPEFYVCNCTNNGHGTLYSDAVANYKTSYDALSKNYNIVYTGYIWNQGEHDEVYGKNTANTVSSDAAYYAAYKSMHNGLMTELDLDFGGISVVRADRAGATAQGSMSLTIARNAQYKLCNDIDNLYMISTIGETCDHSVMDQSNTIHYAQATFNKMGVDCANNLYKYLGLDATPAEFSGIQIYSEVGLKIAEFDKDGAAVGEDIIAKDGFTQHILSKLSTLGTDYSISGYTLTAADGTDLTNYIDEYGRINWTNAQVGRTLKKIQVKCVIK